jgi:hypothetical protein
MDARVKPAHDAAESRNARRPHDAKRVAEPATETRLQALRCPRCGTRSRLRRRIPRPSAFRAAQVSVMPSMYRASVPVFVRGLTILSTLLQKGEAHARAQGDDPAALVAARLAPDMLPLAGQVQRASDAAKLALARLTGVESPKMEDNEQSFDDLYARIDKTKAWLSSLTEAQLAGSDTRRIELKVGEFKPVFDGEAYLFSFALPNFFFHVTTAYDILRHAGVPLGKRDYLGPFEG